MKDKSSVPPPPLTKNYDDFSTETLKEWLIYYPNHPKIAIIFRAFKARRVEELVALALDTSQEIKLQPTIRRSIAESKKIIQQTALYSKKQAENIAVGTTSFLKWLLRALEIVAKLFIYLLLLGGVCLIITAILVALAKISFKTALIFSIILLIVPVMITFQKLVNHLFGQKSKKTQQKTAIAKQNKFGPILTSFFKGCWWIIKIIFRFIYWIGIIGLLIGLIVGCVFGMIRLVQYINQNYGQNVNFSSSSKPSSKPNSTSNSTQKPAEISTRFKPNSIQYINQARVSPSGKYFVVIANNGAAYLISLLRGKVALLENTSHSFLSIGITPDEKYLLLGKSNADVEIWNIYTQQIDKTIRTHSQYQTNSLSISWEGRYFAVNDRSQLKIWNISSGQSEIIWDKDIDIQKVYFATDQPYLSVQSHWENIIFDISNKKPIQVFPDSSQCFCLTPDGKLFICSKNSKLHTYHTDTGKLLTSWDYNANYMFLNQDTRYLLISEGSYYSTQVVKLLNFQTGQTIHTFQTHTAAVTTLGIAPNDTYCFSGSQDGTAQFFDINTGKLFGIFAFGDNHTWIFFTPDGYFCCSPYAKRYVDFNCGATEFESYFNKFYDEDLIADTFEDYID